jgi:MFS family permease
VLFAIGAVGGIGGALLAGPMARRFGDARVLWLSGVINLPAILALPLTTHGAGLTWFVVGQFVLNLGLALFNVCVRAAIQRSTPSEMMGRTMASIRVFSRSALPIGSLVGGAIAAAYSPRAALFVTFALYILVPLRLFFSPIGRVRSVDELTVAPSVA